MTERVRINPIHVEKTATWKGEVVWMWACDEHIRARGYHHRNRRTDRYRARRGQPPDDHPWIRAQRGANEHHHRYHSACPCHGKDPT